MATNAHQDISIHFLSIACSAIVQANIKGRLKEPHHWPFVRKIHPWPVVSTLKGPVRYHECFIWWRGIFSWFFAFVHVLCITQISPTIFPLKLIYPQIAFYTKYSVLTFSTDVVSTILMFITCSVCFQLHPYLSSCSWQSLWDWLSSYLD